MVASNTVNAGRRKVESTSSPGLEIGLREEKTEMMIAIAEPAPTKAAISEERNTSFRRILIV